MIGVKTINYPKKLQLHNYFIKHPSRKRNMGPHLIELFCWVKRKKADNT